jgi:aspartate/methionine/tyrosine aminotransferase
MARAKALEAAGRSIIHMEVGEPDFPTPAPIIDAGLRFVQSGQIFYTQALGLPALREAIAGFYHDRYGAAVDPDRIVVTSGASAALLLALALLVDSGEEILLADPGYPCNPNFARLLGALPVRIPVDAGSGYQPRPAQVAQFWGERTRALVRRPGQSLARGFLSSW